MSATQQIELAIDAVYRAPSGRCVMWRPQATDVEARQVATFAYLRMDGPKTPEANADGFSLSRENWGILKRLA